jgi:hypothetical protein
MPVVGSILKTTMRGLEKNVVSPMLKEAEQLLGPKIGLFSKLEQEVSRLNFTKMPAEQLRKTMTGRQVSPAETKSVLGGLEGTVNREQVRDAIAMKGMKLEDVVLGEVKPMTVKETGSLSDREFRAQMNLESANATKFSSYQEPGAVPGSYREMFVTAPVKEAPKNNLLQEGQHEWKDGHGAYADIDNPIVRIRYNDREVNGKKILFVEEMQGPAGDTKYFVVDKDVLPLDEKYVKSYERRKFDTRKEAEQYAEASGIDPKRIIKQPEGEQGKMPPALQSRIYDIGVKRTLALAKEKGYDGVAWTTGEMQVQRYKDAILKEIDTVTWHPGTNAETKFVTLFATNKHKYHFDVNSKTGEIINASTGFEQSVGKNISELVGKDLGPRILSERGNEVKALDIKIGGEGLKSVYDKTLPEKFKKYGKEYVGDIEIPANDVNKKGVYFKSSNTVLNDILQSTPLQNIRKPEVESLLRFKLAKQMDTNKSATLVEAWNSIKDIELINNSNRVPYIPITSKTPGRFPIYSVGPVGAIMKLLQEEKENKKNAQSTYHR